MGYIFYKVDERGERIENCPNFIGEFVNDDSDERMIRFDDIYESSVKQFIEVGDLLYSSNEELQGYERIYKVLRFNMYLCVVTEYNGKNEPELLDDDNRNIMRKIHERKCDINELLEYLTDNNVDIPIAVAESLQANEYILNIASRHRDRKVRLAALNNPNIGIDAIRFLLNDTDIEIAEKAKKILEKK